MAKQVPVTKAPNQFKSRSPKTNLYFALFLGVVFLVLFKGSIQGAVVYGVASFMFFCTVDYCMLHYRMNKK